MKAISVFPGKPESVHLTDLPKPALDQVPNGAIKVFCQVADI